MKLIYLVPPGAGKGTQSEQICKDFGVVQLSTGDILRANRKQGTELGQKAQKFMDAGELVPDNIIIDMIKEELKKPELANGYILDGFPRTVAQAEALDEQPAGAEEPPVLLTPDLVQGTLQPLFRTVGIAPIFTQHQRGHPQRRRPQHALITVVRAAGDGVHRLVVVIGLGGDLVADYLVVLGAEAVP